MGTLTCANPLSSLAPTGGGCILVMTDMDKRAALPISPQKGLSNGRPF